MSGFNSGRRLALKQGFAAAAVSAASASGLMLGTPARAAGQAYRYKLGIALDATHPTTVNLSAAAAEIARASNGRLDIRVFPSSQLGNDTDMISQVRAGAIDFVSTAGLIWGTLVPVASISGIGFAFPGYEQVWSAMDGELGAHIRAAFTKVNLMPLPKIWDHGFRQVTSSNRQIQSPQDLNGFKIRVPLSPALTSMFKAFGAAPAGINMAETYTALQTRVVDGQENPLTILQTQKLYEVQKYCSLTSHVWDGFWLVANQRAWNALPEDLRQLAAATFDAYAVKQRQAVDALNTRLREALKGRGMAFNQPDVKAFRDYLSQAGFYKGWQQKFPAESWALLEKYAGKLA